MNYLNPQEMRDVALDIEVELDKLAQLHQEIEHVNRLIQTSPDIESLLYENQALKLHNFYNGCERIFRIVASELNGALPSSYDWHRRLLDRMTREHEGRPALISVQTGQLLGKFLAFRHVVRNIYGFELETKRIADLLVQYETAWQSFEAEILQFIAWLKQTAQSLD